MTAREAIRKRTERNQSEDSETVQKETRIVRMNSRGRASKDRQDQENARTVKLLR